MARLPCKPSTYEKGSYFKQDWEERLEEILFPGQHIPPHFPWKPFQWEENRSDMSNEFARFQQVSITIKSLGHVTHNKEFGEICKNGLNAYIFLPKEKKGKSGYYETDGSPLGYSFIAQEDCTLSHKPDEESSYRYIGRDDDILPGHYIWWSVEADPNELPQPFPKKYSVSNAISNHNSPYGNKKIYGYFKHVLEAYQSSLRDPSNGKLPPIEFRVGGTLRYRYEVCHVVIVCRENEKQLPLDKYPLWEEGKNKIRYGDAGEVKFVDTIKITINNGIKYNFEKKECYCWDQTIFGFHFTENIQMLAPHSCFKDKDVGHDTERCIRTKRVDGEWLCPNEIKNKETRKRSGQPLEEEPLLKKMIQQ